MPRPCAGGSSATDRESSQTRACAAARAAARAEADDPALPGGGALASCAPLPAAGALRDPAREREARFEAFLATHRERARRLAWRLVGGDDAAADDVAQNAFLRAWRGLGRFRGDSSLETWFYRILVRQAANHRRWRAVRDRFATRPADETPGALPGAGDPALRRRIAAALGRLSRGQREAFVLVHLEGFSVPEAADVLGKAPGTLKSHLHRALATLRRELADLSRDASAS